MGVNFAELLKKPVADAVKPPTKPAGTYLGTIKEFKFDESRQKKTPFVRFVIASVNPGPDIAAEDLEGIDLTKWNPGKDYYLTDDALYRLREVIESCGIATEGRDFAETIPEMRGKQVQFAVTQRAGEGDKMMELYNDIGDLSGVKD
jgi:hypothetical protein